MPRYLSTYTAAVESPPTPEKDAAIGKLVEDMTRAGVLLDTGAILPPSQGGARLKLEGGKLTVTDGPFPETKELIVGYAIIQAKNREEAIEHIRRFMKIAGDGECDVRLLMGPEDGRPPR